MRRSKNAGIVDRVALDDVALVLVHDCTFEWLRKKSDFLALAEDEVLISSVAFSDAVDRLARFFELLFDGVCLALLCEDCARAGEAAPVSLS